MDTSTIELMRVINFSILFGHPVLAIFAIFSIKKREITGLTKAVWVWIVLFMPFIGPLSMWVLNPKSKKKDSIST